ncbi:MAG: DUF1566 domain-containing protein [Bacteroidaceae bacterium]|nr:DUF1566 domain-containing protein [Bacteroidaceae bacterium]
MKKYLFISVAFLTAFAGCSKDNKIDCGTELTFTASMENTDTRATFDSGNKRAVWANGDQICVNGSIFVTSGETVPATFEYQSGEFVPGDTYEAYFPASLCEDGKLTLPSEITETGSGGLFNMPMHASSESTDLLFKNLCGVLKITVYGYRTDLNKLQSVKVSSSNCAVSGPFTVVNDAAVLESPSETGGSLTVTFSNPNYAKDFGSVFYIPIPAQTYRNLKIEFSDGTNTESMTTKKDADIIIERNCIYPISFADNTPEPEPEPEMMEIEGLKITDFNLGATSAMSKGSEYNWKDAMNSFSGSNLRLPTKDELEHFMNALSAGGDEYVSSAYYTSYPMKGICFSDKVGEDKVYFPFQYLETHNDGGYGYYWTSTEVEANSDYVWCMLLGCNTQGELSGSWTEMEKTACALSHPVSNDID